MAVLKMKDSGVEWIGLVPNDWSALSLRYLLSFSGSGTTPKELDTLVCENENGINWLNTGDLTDGYIENIPQKLKPEVIHQQSALRIYPSGSLVIAMYGATVGKLGILQEQATTNQACCVLVPNKDLLENKYLFYQLYAARSELISLAKGGGQPNISQASLRKFKVCFTELEKQTAIANFLDTKCSEIDSLTADIEKQIETLQEYKKSVITEAVTTGLDPNVEMKDSGLQWIEQIPSHWSISKLGLIAKTSSGSTPTSSNYGDYYEDGEHLWVRTLDLNMSVLFDTEKKITDKALTDFSCSYVEKGAVLIAMYGGAGTIGKYALAGVPLTTNQAVCAVIPSEQLESKYLFYLASAYRSHWMVGAVGTRKDPNISQEVINNWKVLLPSISEQTEISNYLDQKCNEIDLVVTLN